MRQRGMSHTKAHALRPIVLAVLATGLLAACTESPPDDAQAADEDTEVAGYSDELESTLVAAFDLEYEVQDVVNRLLVGCMSEAGFDVHPMGMTDTPVPWELESNTYPTVGSTPPALDSIPTVEEAADVGVDLGVHHDPDNPTDGNVGPNDHLDLYWSEMTQDYRDAYDMALYGQSQADRNNGENPEDGPEAKPGCQLDVYESIGFEETDILRPTPLVSHAIGIGDYETVEVLDVWDDWTMCVADRDHPEIEYRDQSVYLWNYVALFYNDLSSALSSEGQKFDAPTDAPWEYGEALEKEIAFAIDVAECADEVDLRAITQSSWDETMRVFAVDNEAIIFAWYENLTEALANAQAVLSE